MASSVADIAARLTLNGSQFSSELSRQFGSVEAAARDTAARTKSAFEGSFNEIQQIAQRALSMPRNASGALDLNAGQARQAAVAAQAQATALRELAVAAAAAAVKTGDLSENTRLSVQAARAAATEAEISAKAALQQANALDVLQAELNQTKSSTEMVIQGNRMMNASMGLAARGSNASRIAMVQASQQVQDFVIQVGMGQNPIRAFAMQASQMAFVMQGVGGTAGKLAAFFSGPWGVALTLGITAAGMFAGKLFETGKAADAAKDATVDFANKQNEIGRFVDVLTGKIINQNKVLIQNAILKRQTAMDQEQEDIHKLRAQITDKINSAAATQTGSEFVAERQPSRPAFTVDPDLIRVANGKNGIRAMDAELGKLAARRPELQALRKEISDLAAQAENLKEQRDIHGAEITALQGGGTEDLKRLTGQAQAAIRSAATGGGGSHASNAASAASSAKDEAAAREKIFATSQKQLSTEAESFRYFAMRAAGLDKEADLAQKIATIEEQSAERMAELTKGMSPKEAEEFVRQQSLVSDAFSEQLGKLNEQGAAYEQLLVQDGDRAKLTDAQKKALDDQRKAMLDQLTAAAALAKTEEERKRLLEAIARLEGGVTDAKEEGQKRADAQKKADDEFEQFRQRQAQEAQRQFDSLADFYMRAFQSGGKSIWKDFKQEGMAILAQIAAAWTLAMLSGQKTSFGGILAQIGAQSGVAGGFGGFNPFSILFGGGAKAASASAANNGSITALNGGVMQITDVPVTPSPTSLKGMLGSAGTGAMIGAGIGGIGQMLFPKKKGISTGSTIGGALGSVVGSVIPGVGTILGGVVGSVLGGLVGGLFGGGKTPKSSAIVTGVDSDPTLRYDVGGTGDQAMQLAGSVQQGLSQIADALGADVGAFKVSIGTRDDKYVVQGSGNGDTKSQYGVKSYSTAEEAVKAAILDALQDGAITGISQASMNILKAGKDLQKSIEKAVLIESIPKQLKAMLDPVGAAIDDLNEKWKKTVDALKEGGASAEQMAQAQQLYQMQLEQVKETTKEASADLKDFLNSLAFGSSSPYSLRDQEGKAQAALQPYLDKINAGQAVDQSKYIDAAQQFLDIERQLYGSTAKFFDSMDMIQAATGKAISTIDNAVPVRTVSDPFNEATANNTATANDLLEQIRDGVNALRGDGGSGGGATVRGGGGGSYGGGFIGADARGFVPVRAVGA